VAAAISAASPALVARAALGGAAFEVSVDGSPVELGPDDVIVTQTPRSGWAVASGDGETVALDITITPALLREGLAREVIRLVQDARKNAGLDISDRIWLRWSAPEGSALADALTSRSSQIAAETLATDYAPAAAPPDATTAPLAAGSPEAAAEYADPDLGLRFWLRRAVPT
jgi:isoleucyl-tRNA synthetase